ncbi:hypothetical protein WN55_07576 [Dufourea novaeangliae]|uniref:Uncharacterized protein n=1 Tax=Dufourea novaeangliae TaxID=178035 RepID=A0A154P456_DUFNO|nr:hypothetical protein WN55_07576 [Dufourea novaeangliae]
MLPAESGIRGSFGGRVYKGLCGHGVESDNEIGWICTVAWGKLRGFFESSDECGAHGK